MSSATYKLSSIASHINTIGNYIHRHDISKDSVFDEFYDYFYRTDWIIARQNNKKTQNLIKKRMAIIFEKYYKHFIPKNVRKNFNSRIKNYREAYADIDLTIIIPAYNCCDLIEDTINSIRAMNGLSYNILLINDGSSDNTLSFCRQLEKKIGNLHVFTQDNRGAGRARNALIPLITGKYAYFLDADDLVDSEALEAAVKDAMKRDSDLHFFKYRICYYDEGQERGMFNADAEIWKKLQDAKKNDERQVLLSGLINYPWNRIIKTSLLHDENIFFGGTIVHNDIPYHWHSISVAQNIGFSNVEVCSHRKFAKRQQVTNISDKRRLEVFEALRYSQKKIEASEASERLLPIWNKFCVELIEWAKTRIPKELIDEFEEKRKMYER